jgi:hypothetical protein
MKAIDLRVRAETLELAHALVEQRGLERAALLREALEVGMLLLAASGAPAEDGAADQYGTLTGSRLAQRLRPRLAAVLDFLCRYSAAPLTVSIAALPTSQLAPLTQDTRQAPGPIRIDAVVNGALEGFGVDALGED